MNLTKVQLFANTPFRDFNNYMNLGKKEALDAFFDSAKYDNVTYETKFNFIRDRGTLNVSIDNPVLKQFGDYAIYWLMRVNYIRFKSDFEPNIWYYAFVVDQKYLNNNAYQYTLVIDGLTTFAQGDVSRYAKNVQIERQHLTRSTYEQNLQYLMTNDDILNFTNKEYINTSAVVFKDFGVVFQSTIDLESDFGDEDNPKLSSASGVNYDGVVSPVNLYYVAYNKFNDLMKSLKEYPWITQGISKVLLIPVVLIDVEGLVSIKPNKGNFASLFKFPETGRSKNIDDGYFNTINKNWSDVYGIYGIDADNKHLLHEGYAGVELTNWQGQNIALSFGYFGGSGLEFTARNISGYDSQIYIYPKYYKMRDGDGYESIPAGSYLNNAVVFNNWDTVPILTDNYKLQLAQSAHQREYANQNTLSGQVDRALDNGNSLQDRLSAGFSLLSAGLNPMSIAGRANDEWNYYRQQQAKFADMAITAPSVSEQSTNNAFGHKYDTFGLTVKLTSIPKSELDKVRAYHANFGYSLPYYGTIENTESMSHVNYAKFKGNWYIPEVPAPIMETIRTLFEIGVRAYHNPDKLDNPFEEDITFKNRMVQ